MGDDLRKALRLLDSADRWRWYALGPLALVAAAAEAFGAAAVFGLLTIVLDPARAATLPIAASVSARADGDPRSLVVALCALLIAFYLGRNALLAFAGHAQERVVHDSITHLSRRLLLNYLTAPYAFHFHRNSASLIQRMTQSIEAACTLVLSSVVSLFTETVISLAILGVLAAAAPAATLAAAAATGLVIAILLRLTGRIFERLGRDEQRHDEAALQQLQQSLGAMKEVKTAGRERYFHDRYSASRAALSRAQYRQAALHDVLRLAIETVFVCALLLVVILLVWRGRTGPDVVSVLGLYAYAGFRLVPAANRITRAIGQIRVGRPYLRDVVADFDALEESQAAAPPAPAPVDAARFTSEIRFEDVSYSYGAGVAAALQDVSLAIRKGEAIGLVGQTGAGKSTLVDLLLGLLPPTSGRISVDGRDLRDHARWWQRQIGYVPQAFFIADDTLRRNVAFAIADEDIDEGRVRAAVRVAQLEDFVAGLPDGLDTLVGERGIRLSGGERQRVVIARALYHEPQVLVFDEATAALDNQTERDLARAIEALHGTITLIVIAHRLTTVRGSDRLIVLDQGRVAATGSYDALLVSHAGFRALAAGGE
jgi:ATP-binding cassette subfamily C protein